MFRNSVMMLSVLMAIPFSVAVAAEISVSDLAIRPSRGGDVVVSGTINGESTFGWTTLLRLVPRPGNRGTVAFTAVDGLAPTRRSSLTYRENARGEKTVHVEQVVTAGVDITQVVDVWAGSGSFTPYDTNRSTDVSMNGAVDDNGTFVSTPMTFSGELVHFPVVASAGAQGVWDVVLSTPEGDSSWEGVPTGLVGGTITVSVAACMNSTECDDGDSCTRDVCKGGTCRHASMGPECLERNRTRKNLRRGKKRTKP